MDWRGIQGKEARGKEARGNTGGMQNINLKIREFENLKMNTNTRRTSF